MGFKPGNPGGGRPKGIKNKATRDIQALIQKTVNFEDLTAALKELALEKKEKWAFEMLFQYGFGKPVEIQTVNPVTVNMTTPETTKHEHVHKLDPTTTSNLQKLADKFTKR